ncbi:MAG: cytochrome c3 family protein [Fuerstiella sp.]|nr:cytochrome c3 family protein [Fuerstiella sp.]
MAIPGSRSIRRAPVTAAILACTAVMIALQVTGMERLSSPGGSRDIHAGLACTQCHRPADGTLRQQVQANVKHWLGFRKYGADFVHKQIKTDDCLDCHSSETDPHSTYRFLEPKFAEVRTKISPHDCLSCHTEHRGEISVRGGNFCQHCHQDLKLENDITSPSHELLTADARWDTCLMCHDYHDNHHWNTPRDLTQAVNVELIQDYLNGSEKESPYGDLIRLYADERTPIR